MIIIMPLFPIAIAIIVLSFALFGEFTDNVDTISTVVMVLSVIVFLCVLIYCLTRDVSAGRKVFSSIVTIGAGAFSTFILTQFIQGLGEIELSLLGLMEFAFTAVAGGGIVLAIVVGCVWASLTASGDW